MINILPQPRQMFEFAARLSYFRITTCSCDFFTQKLILLTNLTEMEISKY